jgi:predicted GNAT family acetyltransferase
MEELKDNAALSRYELPVGDRIATAYYRRDGDRLVLTHTEVPTELRGQGVGAILVRAVLDDIRARGLRVVPRCPFVKSFIDSHSDYLDLLA